MSQESLQISHRTEDGVTVVEIRGRADSTNHEVLAEHFNRLLASFAESNDGPAVVLLLRDLEFANTHGFRKIISFLKQLHALGANYAFAEPQQKVNEYIDLLGLAAFISIYQTQVEAVNAVKNNQADSTL